MNRRHFLQITAASLAYHATRSMALIGTSGAHLSSDPFTMGVASGDPSPDGIVLWTRLAPQPSHPAGGMSLDSLAVRWELSSDSEMRHILQRGSVLAMPELGHSIHVEIDGLLPARQYFYRFHAGGATSPIGRTKTAPAPNSKVDRARFAFASCQHYEYGYYNAHRDMAQQELDAVLFLGDYIYEYHLKHYSIRLHDLTDVISLEDYRHQYAQYKNDHDLKACHAAHPWIVTLDDHEVENNWAGIYPEWSHPQPDFRARRAAAFQAYYENMPLRRSSLPIGDGMRIHRTLPYGKLLQFTVVDTRQFRTRQPCGDDFKVSCEERLNPASTMMGSDQEAWFQRALTGSVAQWNVIANQVMIAQLKMPAKDKTILYNMDQWDGYPAARKRMTDFLGQARPANPVFVTGDFHQTWVGDLKEDFDNPSSASVAAELVGTSISSGGNGMVKGAHSEENKAANPHLLYNNDRRGYFVCEATPLAMTATLRTVDRVTDNESQGIPAASFQITSGDSEVRQTA